MIPSRLCRSRTMQLGAALSLAVLALSVFAGRAARAESKIDELAKILASDSNYKVRLQAALVLGKLGDPQALGPLAQALDDANRLVRGMAAQSLGRLGAVEAVPSLTTVLKRETDPFVRKEIEKSLALLQRQTAQPKPRIVITLGSFGGGVASVDLAMRDVVKSRLKKELGKLAFLGFAAGAGAGAGGIDDKNSGKSSQLGFLIDGTVSRMDDVAVAGAVEVNCDVKVMVARWPSKSIILWTNAGAAVQGGSRPLDRETSRRDCLEASAGQLGEDLTKFFQSQGG